MACAYVLARRADRAPGASLAAALLVGVSAPMFVYATQVYPEVPAALCVVILVLLTRARRRRDRASGRRCCCSALMWLGVKYGPLGHLSGPAGARAPRPAGGSPCSRPRVPIGIHYLAFHWQTYGDFTPYAVNLVYAGSDTPELLARHVELGRPPYRLLGLWVDREFGLVRWAPILALALPGAVAGEREGYGRVDPGGRLV